ncbi:MAG: hypothetical protein ACREFQ_00295, partial [Stellaceae bacterium]
MAYCGRRRDRDRHRQFHRHAALDDILEGLLENRPAAYQQADHADDADCWERLPDSEPHRGRRDCDEGDAHGFRPFEGMIVIVAVLMVAILAIPMVVLKIVMARFGGRRNCACFGGVGWRAGVGGV